MNMNKKLFSFVLLSTMFCPVRTESNEDTTTISQESTHKSINFQDATTLLESFTNTLTHGSNFSFNDQTYTVNEGNKVLTPSEISALTTIVSEVASTTITTVAESLENHAHTQTAAQNHNSVALENAVTLLQTFQQNLAVGSTFTLNGVHYTVVAHSTTSSN